MSVQTQIDRLASAKAAIKTAIEGKGVTVPDATLLDGMAALIESIEAGGGASGFSAIATGTVTPTTNPSSLTVSHGLGQTPDVTVVFSANSAPPTNGMLTSVVLSNGRYFNLGSASSSSYSGWSSMFSSSAVGSSTVRITATVGSSKNSYFAKNYTYRWIAGVYA